MRARAEFDQVWLDSVDVLSSSTRTSRRGEEIDAVAIPLDDVKDASCVADHQVLTKPRTSPAASPRRPPIGARASRSVRPTRSGVASSADGWRRYVALVRSSSRVQQPRSCSSPCADLRIPWSV